MKYCLGNNDKKGKSVHIQYGCNFPQEFATWLNLGIWGQVIKKKRDVFAFLQVTYVRLNGKEFKSHTSLSSICCSMLF